MPYVIIDDVVVWEPDGYPATVTALDGSEDTFSPLAVTAWAPSSQSGNIIHEMIDGTISATLLGDLPRAGNLTFIVANDTDAESGRVFFSRRCAFALDYPDRPVVNMTFIRSGQVTAAIHSQATEVWEFQVGFQEIAP